MQSRGNKSESPAVTVVVSRRIRPGFESDFEEWVDGVVAEAAKFEGHEGMTLLSPADTGGDEYVLVFRFDTALHLRAWETSAIRAEWLAKVERMTEGAPRVRQITGLEYWFTLPNAPVFTPPRYKMAIVTIAAIYPLSLFLNPLIASIIPGAPIPLRGLVLTTVLVVLMTYCVMPAVTRMFKPWLFPSVGKKV